MILQAWGQGTASYTHKRTVRREASARHLTPFGPPCKLACNMMIAPEMKLKFRLSRVPNQVRLNDCN
jgi:hypothetical protein